MISERFSCSVGLICLMTSCDDVFFEFPGGAPPPCLTSPPCEFFSGSPLTTPLFFLTIHFLASSRLLSYSGVVLGYLSCSGTRHLIPLLWVVIFPLFFFLSWIGSRQIFFLRLMLFVLSPVERFGFSEGDLHFSIVTWMARSWRSTVDVGSAWIPPSGRHVITLSPSSRLGDIAPSNRE